MSLFVNVPEGGPVGTDAYREVPVKKVPTGENTAVVKQTVQLNTSYGF